MSGAPGRLLKVLALDLATRTGWAVGRRGANPAFGIAQFPIKSTHGAVGAALQGWLLDMIETYAPDRIWYEAPLVAGRHAGHRAAALMIKLAGVVEVVGHRRSVPVIAANIGTVRKAVLGNGRADKADALAWCADRGLSCDDHNAADALVVWAYATAQDHREAP